MAQQEHDPNAALRPSNFDSIGSQMQRRQYRVNKLNVERFNAWLQSMIDSGFVIGVRLQDGSWAPLDLATVPPRRE